MQYTWDRREMYAKVWLENSKERYYLENQGIDGRILLTWIVMPQDGSV
jgi:hypothetical protein